MSKQKPMKISNTVPPEPDRVRLGQPVQFVPAALYHDITAARKDRKAICASVVGIICYINRPHRYFTVTYTIGKNKFKESFKY